MPAPLWSFIVSDENIFLEDLELGAERGKEEWNSPCTPRVGQLAPVSFLRQQGWPTAAAQLCSWLGSEWCEDQLHGVDVDSDSVIDHDDHEDLPHSAPPHLELRDRVQSW